MQKLTRKQKFDKANDGKFTQIFNNNNRILRVYSLLTDDVLPETASEKYRQARAHNIEKTRQMLEKHAEFRDKTDRTQNDIDLMLRTQNDFLKPFQKVGL